MNLELCNKYYQQGKYLEALHKYRVYSKKYPERVKFLYLDTNISLCLDKLDVVKLFSPLVSVIVPAHNVEKYIKRCLESIIKQTLNNIEIIVVDDGSIDSTLSIVKYYAEKDERITVINNSEASGNSGCPRNQALYYATGKYVCFIDADDYVDPEMLEDMYGKAIEEDADICTCNGFFKETDGVEELITLKNVSVKEGDSRKDLFTLPQFPIIWYRIYKLKFIKTNSIFLGDFKVSADLIFSFKALLLANKIVEIDKAYYHYNFARPGSTIERRKNTQVLDIFKSYEATISFIIEKDFLNYSDIVINKFIGDYFYCTKNMSKNVKVVFDSFSTVFVKRYLNFVKDRSLISTYSNKVLDELYNSYLLEKETEYNLFIKKPSSVDTPIDISVIIPSHNVEEYIKKCLDSVLGQTLKSIEVIVINDGSVDNTEEIIDKYRKNDARVKAISINKSSGYPGVSRNIGLTLAKGEYISFVDSDDWIDRECLYRFNTKAKEMSSDIIFSKAFFREEGKVNKKFNIGLSYNGKIDNSNREIIVNTNFLSNVWHKIYRREFLIKNSIYFPRMYVSEDLCFSLICAFLAEYVSVANTQGYHYRYNRENSTTQQRMGNKSLKQIFEYSEFLEFFKRYDLPDELYQTAIVKKVNSFFYTYTRLTEPDIKEYFKFEVKNILSNETLKINSLNEEELKKYQELTM